MTPLFNPFPGLRPFRESEAHLFFGRSAHIDELLTELARSRFVAVMGASASGKSSLVNAGVLPALHGGFAARVGSHWRIASFRPGVSPIHNLARALAMPPPAREVRFDRPFGFVLRHLPSGAALFVGKVMDPR